MNYGTIKNVDIANGPGVRVSLFVSGCTHHCRDCFNPETWDASYGQKFAWDAEKQILDALTPDYIAGLSVLGGEPMEPGNQPDVLALLRDVREKLPGKTIWVYSGYLFDKELQSDLPAAKVLPPEKPVKELACGEGTNVEITEGGANRTEVWYRASDGAALRLPTPYRSAHTGVTDELLTLMDVLVDGKFIYAEKDLSLRFRGSRNQRLVDVQRSLKTGTVVLWEA